MWRYHANRMDARAASSTLITLLTWSELEGVFNIYCSTGCHFSARMHIIQFRLGLCPRPGWGSSQRSPGPLAGGERLALSTPHNPTSALDPLSLDPGCAVLKSSFKSRAEHTAAAHTTNRENVAYTDVTPVTTVKTPAGRRIGIQIQWSATVHGARALDICVTQTEICIVHLAVHLHVLLKHVPVSSVCDVVDDINAYELTTR